MEEKPDHFFTRSQQRPLSSSWSTVSRKSKSDYTGHIFVYTSFTPESTAAATDAYNLYMQVLTQHLTFSSHAVMWSALTNIFSASVSLPPYHNTLPEAQSSFRPVSSLNSTPPIVHDLSVLENNIVMWIRDLTSKWQQVFHSRVIYWHLLREELPPVGSGICTSNVLVSSQAESSHTAPPGMKAPGSWFTPRQPLGPRAWWGNIPTQPK